MIDGRRNVLLNKFGIAVCAASSAVFSPKFLQKVRADAANLN